jgi:ribonuclease HI
VKYQNDRKHGKKSIHVKKAIDWAMDSVMVVEAEACIRGLYLGKDMSVGRIVIETDSKLVSDM